MNVQKEQTHVMIPLEFVTTTLGHTAVCVQWVTQAMDAPATVRLYLNLPMDGRYFRSMAQYLG